MAADGVRRGLPSPLRPLPPATGPRATVGRALFPPARRRSPLPLQPRPAPRAASPAVQIHSWPTRRPFSPHHPV